MKKNVYEIEGGVNRKVFYSEDDLKYIIGVEDKNKYSIVKPESLSNLKELTFTCILKSCDSKSNAPDDKSLDTIANSVLSLIGEGHGVNYAIYDKKIHYEIIFEKLYDRINTPDYSLGIILKYDVVEYVINNTSKSITYYLMYDKNSKNAEQWRKVRRDVFPIEN